MFRVESTTDLDQLLGDTEQWNALSDGVPFRETSWLGPWWKHYSDGRQAYVLIARDQNNAIRGILPLYTDDQKSEFSALRIIGDGDAFSEYSSIICKNTDALAVGDAMGRFLANSGEWSLIQFEGIVEGDVAIVSLCKAMQTQKCVVHADSRMHTWYRPRNESWDDHLKQFGKTQRRKTRRWLDKVTKLDGMEKCAPQNADDAQEALASLIELHQKRWNSVGETGSYSSPDFRHFISDCVSEFYSRGRLYLPSLRWHGDTVSSELHFIGGDQRLYCYSSGFDIDHSDLEPGRILNADTLHEIYCQDFAGVDYLRGDEPYKKRMGATPTRVLRVIVSAPAWGPKLRHAAWFKAFEMKQLMRRCAGRKPVEKVDLFANPLPGCTIGAPVSSPANAAFYVPNQTSL